MAGQTSMRKQKPKLRIVGAAEANLREPMGFIEFAHAALRRCTGTPDEYATSMAKFTLGMLWASWHEGRGTDEKTFIEPAWDALVADIYARNNARVASVQRFPRLAAVDGVRVQA